MEVGFAALLPCINQAHLTVVHSSRDIQYEVFVHFIGPGLCVEKSVMKKVLQVLLYFFSLLYCQNTSSHRVN